MQDASANQEPPDLVAAVESGDLQLVESLLNEAGVDVNSRGRSLYDRYFKNTPLHVASAKGYVAIAQALIRHGANVNAKDRYGGMPIYDACCAGHTNVARVLIANGANIDAIGGSDGFTPITRAFFLHNFSMVNFLVENGANLLAKDRRGNTALHAFCAFCDDHLENVGLLMLNGADVHAKDDVERTPLHLARNPRVVRLLIDYGANANARDCLNATALHSAASLGDLEVARELIRHGADVNARNNLGNSPLHESFRRNTEVADLLLANGADVHDRNILEETPLHGACQYGRLTFVQCLLSRGVYIYARDWNGSTPLTLACQKDFPDIAWLLLRQEYLSVKDSEGRTQLHWACHFGDLDVVELLLSRGFDIHAKDNRGNTPLDAACSANRHECVWLLVRKDYPFLLLEQWQPDPHEETKFPSILSLIQFLPNRFGFPITFTRICGWILHMKDTINARVAERNELGEDVRSSQPQTVKRSAEHDGLLGEANKRPRLEP